MRAGTSSAPPDAASGSVLHPPQLNLSQIRISGAGEEDQPDSMDTSIMSDRQIEAELMDGVDGNRDSPRN